ncbi:MAG: hypothetical protein R2764_03355 [Bacteroidales bacterium]
MVYSKNNITEISRPGLPQEITNEIGFLIDQMEIYSVAMMDNNTIQSHTTIIDRFFIQNVPIYYRSDESINYHYSNTLINMTKQEKEVIF